MPASWPMPPSRRVGRRLHRGDLRARRSRRLGLRPRGRPRLPCPTGTGTFSARWSHRPPISAEPASPWLGRGDRPLSRPRHPRGRRRRDGVVAAVATRAKRFLCLPELAPSTNRRESGGFGGSRRGHRPHRMAERLGLAGPDPSGPRPRSGRDRRAGSSRCHRPHGRDHRGCDSRCGAPTRTVWHLRSRIYQS